MAEIAVGSYRGHVYDSEISVDHTEMMAAVAAGDVTGVAAVYIATRRGCTPTAGPGFPSPPKRPMPWDAFIIPSQSLRAEPAG